MLNITCLCGTGHYCSVHKTLIFREMFPVGNVEEIVPWADPNTSKEELEARWNEALKIAATARATRREGNSESKP